MKTFIDFSQIFTEPFLLTETMKYVHSVTTVCLKKIMSLIETVTLSFNFSKKKTYHSFEDSSRV